MKPDMYFLDPEQVFDEGLSKSKGYEYKYMVDPAAKKNSLLQEMTVMSKVNEIMNGCALHKLPIIKYPQYTRRICGRTWPGEERRRLSKTLERKATRSQAAQLCKYMLFKKGKFIPGKMV